MDFIYGTLFGIVMGIILMTHIGKPYIEYILEELNDAIEEASKINNIITKERE